MRYRVHNAVSTPPQVFQDHWLDDAVSDEIADTPDAASVFSAIVSVTPDTLVSTLGSIDEIFGSVVRSE